MAEFLDTSVVVRYLTADPPDLAEKARALIEGAGQFVITEAVLLETAHVLRRLYGMDREATMDLMTAFVSRPNINVQGMSGTIALESLALARPSGRVSLGDALIWAVARQNAPSTIHTFDKRFPQAGVCVSRLT